MTETPRKTPTAGDEQFIDAFMVTPIGTCARLYVEGVDFISREVFASARREGRVFAWSLDDVTPA